MDKGKEEREQRERCATGNFILDETATLLGRRAGHRFAAERLKNIYSSDVIEILRPEREDEFRALTWFTKYADQAVTFTDCLSFAQMKRGRLRQVFSYDRHFELAGFQRLPSM